MTSEISLAISSSIQMLKFHLIKIFYYTIVTGKEAAKAIVLFNQSAGIISLMNHKIKKYFEVE